MYGFEPNEEQQMLIDVVRRYAEKDMRDAHRDAEEEGEVPKALIEKGWELGILQASVPADYGGFGERSAVTSVLAAEELAFGDLAIALAVMAPGLFALPILLVGSEEQKKNYLPGIVEGEWQPCTAALIEYEFDFDANELSTTAKEEGDEYVLSGEKRYVPYAADAEAMIIYANLDGVTQGFIVEKSTDGLTVGERDMTLGVHALPLYGLHLDNVRVPKANRLGGAEGHDFIHILNSMRVANAALSVGLARASYEYANEYAKDREVLGSMIAQKQSIAFMIAENGTEIEANRLLTWEAAWQLDEGIEEVDKSAYLAEVGAADMVMQVTDSGVQILGGHGYIREHPVELWMRNGRSMAMLTGLAMV
ncbi:MAG: acyl-CoA dehydrogenase [Chloroflexi bacterium]|nr:MAG: acyl-CoA dehydrogenase [Chloroflexota bacterium]MBL1195804.1 acyl-CoA dehydrogenase [Chloroflexota bacterium]NOH13095.1 acyl-CoA dehydrogenase [Chloroflexota bacterium]